jgi:uncharacterized protein YecE (DUF72 family)
MRIHVGTSGYNYPEWRGTFYPEDIKPPKMFAYYAERLKAVEINYTFYRMPTPKTTGAWKAQAPEGFRYSLKAPRRITHDNRLKEGAIEHVAFFADAAQVLGEHAGPLLFQLPPNLKCDLERFDAFLPHLPKDLTSAFEFRHESWLTPEVFQRLADHKAALCIADFGDKTTPLEATARHGYFRLRDEGYTPEHIAKWADEIGARQDKWDEVFVFFKHEGEGKGPEFAKIFIEAAKARGLTVAGQ